MPDFKVYIPMNKGLSAGSSPILENTVSGKTQTRYKFKGIASTSSLDRDKERVSKACMLSMAKKINEKKLPIFGNHEHNWEDMLGCSSSAEVKNDELHIEILSDFVESNPKITQLVNKMNAGFPIGLSIGGKVTKSHNTYEDSIGEEIRIIDDVDLLETSIVGIAANPDAFLSIPDQIAKSLKNASFENNNSEEINLDDVQKSAAQSGIASYGKLGETTIEAKCPNCGKPSEFREVVNGQALYACQNCGQRFSVELPSKANGTEATSQPEKAGAKTVDRQDQEILGRVKSVKNDRNGEKMVSLNKAAEDADEKKSAGNPEESGGDDYSPEEEEEYKAIKPRLGRHFKRFIKEAEAALSGTMKAEGETTVPGGENADAKNTLGGSGGAANPVHAKSAEKFDLMKKAFRENMGAESLTARKAESDVELTFKSMRDTIRKGF